ncbi:MAG: zinc-dependent metalloprotease family protein [Candidatus Sumerlaeia bacterium]|nr:zinc-dependent metalloprotease family protein [Candidatus Sumerlaeia bacterium]
MAIKTFARRLASLAAALSLCGGASAADVFFNAARSYDGTLQPSSRPEIMRTRLAEVDRGVFDALRFARDGERTIAINFFDDAVVEVEFDRLEFRGEDDYSWVGRLKGDDPMPVILAVYKEAISLDVDVPGVGTFAVWHRADGTHEIVLKDESLMPTCGVTEKHLDFGLGVAERPQGPVPAADAIENIDVMVAYTITARQVYGQSGIIAQVNNAMTRTNASYTNSLINLQATLVHMYETPYYDAGNLGTDLGRWAGTTDGFMDEVHTLRELYRADECALLTSSSAAGACGIAYLMATESVGFSSNAFSVTGANCITQESFQHEIGHNMGNMHARADGGAGTYTYSYGHRFTGNNAVAYRTVMAYAPGSRIQYFSNPDVTFQGQPTGVPVGDANEAHNALSMTNNQDTFTVWRLQNDDFANRIAFDYGNITLTGRNLTHDKEAGEPNHAGNAGGASSWWSWTAPASGTATITTVGSAYDTLLAVYTGNSVGALTGVASNDDTSGTTSSVTFAATGGTTYQIAVDGKGGATGLTTLNVALTASPIIETSLAAITESRLEGQSASRAFAIRNAGGSTLSYTVSDNAPWLTVTPGSGTATAEQDTVELTLSAAALSAGTYNAIVTITDALATNSPYEVPVQFEVGAVAPNDDFVDGETVPGSTASTSAYSNNGATTESGEPTTVAGQLITGTLWYRWTAPGSGTTTISTVGSTTSGNPMDTVLGVYTGAAVNALTVIAANDDTGGSGTTSEVTFNAASGTTYHIQAGGWNGAIGNVIVNVSGPNNVESWRER